MDASAPKQVSPTWQRLFAAYVLVVALSAGIILPDGTGKFLALASILLVLYENNKRKGLSMFTMKLGEPVSVAEFFDSTVISACLAAAAALLAFWPQHPHSAWHQATAQAAHSDKVSDMSDYITIGVAVVTLIVAILAAVIARQNHVLQQRQERRDFADSLDRYAQDFSHKLRVTSEVDPAPTFALSWPTKSVSNWAERIGQPNAVELRDWAFSVLDAARDNPDCLRPFEETMIIEAAASEWVINPRSFDKSKLFPHAK